MGCVLRAGGAEFAVGDFLADSPFEPSAVWYRGVKRFKRQAAPGDSGFNLPVSDAGHGDLPGQAADAVRFLRANRGEVLRLRDSAGVEVLVLDFAVDPKPEAVVQFFRFPRELVGLAGELGFELELSVWLVSGADPAEQSDTPDPVA